MTAEIRHLPTSDAAIRNLHAEIERLASLASGSYVSRTPIRISRTEDKFEMEMQWWHDDDDLKIFTVDGTVRICGTLRFETWPDWYALTNEQTRRIANALLSAAAYVDGAEVSE